jgi:hypothetical protein
MQRLDEAQEQAEKFSAEREQKVQPETPLPQLPEADQVHALRAWLDKLRMTVEEGKWKPANVGLGKWLSQARQLLAAIEIAREANAATLKARTELRGLLEALKAKALGLGRAEDATLHALAHEAGELLRQRPTPLKRTQELVYAYEARLL